MMTYAELLVERRTGRRILVLEAAAACGVCRATYAAWEAGRRLPDSRHLPALADLYAIRDRDGMEAIRQSVRRDGGRVEVE